MSSGRALIGTLLILVGLLCNGNVQATSFFDPMDGNLDFTQFLSDNAYGFLPVPIIITDPAVDGGLGAVGLFFHEDDQDKEARLKAMSSADSNAGRYLLPPNVSALAVAATGNGSWFTGAVIWGFSVMEICVTRVAVATVTSIWTFLVLAISACPAL